MRELFAISVNPELSGRNIHYTCVSAEVMCPNKLGISGNPEVSSMNMPPVSATPVVFCKIVPEENCVT